MRMCRIIEVTKRILITYEEGEEKLENRKYTVSVDGEIELEKERPLTFAEQMLDMGELE